MWDSDYSSSNGVVGGKIEKGFVTSPLLPGGRARRCQHVVTDKDGLPAFVKGSLHGKQHVHVQSHECDKVSTARVPGVLHCTGVAT